MKFISPPHHAGKGFVIIAYALGVAHLIFGEIKIAGQPDMLREFTETWRFPVWFMYFIGACQLLGGIGFFIRGLRRITALAMSLIMIGAAVTTIISAQYIDAVMSIIVLILNAVIYFHELKRLTMH